MSVEAVQFIGLAGFVVVLAVLLLWLVLRLGWRLDWLLPWLRGQLLIACLGLVVILGLVANDLWRYQPLPLEGQLLTLSIQANNADGFDLQLEYADRQQLLRLQGDIWALDLQVLRWHGLAHAIGLQDGYRPYRLAGRFITLERQRQSGRQLALHQTPQWRDLWYWLDRIGVNNWLSADALSINFMPLADGARFAIEARPTGLTPVALNQQAQDALRQQP